MARKVVTTSYKSKIPFLNSQPHNHKIIDTQEIAEEFSEYYRKLYNLKEDPNTVSPSSHTIDQLLISLKLPSLSDEQLSSLNAPIIESELTTLIKSHPLGKSPGPNGFSNEYYHTFCPTLTPHLCATYTQTISDGLVPAEMLQATVVTLAKPGKSPDCPVNFRPNVTIEHRY